MPLIKIEIDCIVEPNENTGNTQIKVHSVKVDDKVAESYQPEMEPDPTLHVWDILGTDNEALTIELRGV